MKNIRVDTGEIELQVRDYPHDGKAVLFLHFGGANMVMWRDVVPYFHDDFRVVLIDLRGHGKSDKPQEGYHIDDMAGDVVAIMESLKINKVHIVGSSLGAEVGLSLAANYPDKVRSLVCEGALFNESGPYGLWEGTQEDFIKHAQEKIETLRNKPEKTYDSVDALVAEKKQFFDKHNYWNDTFEAVVRYDAIEKPDGKYVESWGRIALPYTIHYLFYNFAEYYERVQCPVLMMPDEYPGQDERELAIMDGLFKLIKRGKIARVPEWVHPYGWMITPKEGSMAVLKFLSGEKK